MERNVTNMKKRKIKSYYTIFLFETVLLFLVILNSFNSSLSNVYVLPFILFICDVIFFLVLGDIIEEKIIPL